MNEQNTKLKPLTYSSIRFFVSEQMLKAAFAADSLKNPLTEETLLQLLESSGFGGHLLTDEALQNLVENSTNNHQGEISLEKHTDASFELNIDNDKMSACVQIQPADGGNDLSYEEILKVIREASIQEQYIDTEKLASSLINPQKMSVIIATGKLPVKGEDSTFEVLFNPETETAPKDGGDGTIDHYETHDYITVAENQPIMKRIPHTAGLTGLNILGEEVAAESGRLVQFTMDNTVKIDSSNPDLLLAAKKGHPIATDTGVHIDDTLTLESASLSSGNVHFDGSVEIKGEVSPNVVIQASGDIHIHGIVENASLIAGHNITVGAGILSSRLFDQNNDADSTPECTLIAEGTIIAKYCNTICATAKKDILIETYSMHSHLNAGENLVFGNNNGKGVVIGGINYGKFGVKANIIGSDAYVKTNIACGSLDVIKKLNKKITIELERTKNELSLISTVLNKIKSKGSPLTVGKVVLQKAKKIHDEINNLKHGIAELEIKLLSMKQQINCTEKAQIQVHKKLFPNVQITINDVNINNNREREQSVIHCEKHEIHFN